MVNPLSARSPILLVANPTSGRGRARQWLERAQRRLEAEGQEVRAHLTGHRGDAEHLVRAGLQDWGAVWAIGGDGTINELVQGLGGAATPLSILPAGTGNVVARELGIPRRFGPAFRIARAGPLRTLDVGEINGRRFLFMVSAGFDASVVQWVTGHRRGTLRRIDYVPAVRACRRCDEPRFRVVADGEGLGGACWAAIFNVSRYGHGLRLCPSARPDDGFLQLLLLRDPVGPRLPRVLLAALRGRLHLLPDASLRPVRRVLLEEVHCSQVDGDVFAARELDVQVLPGSLRVHAPP